MAYTDTLLRYRHEWPALPLEHLEADGWRVKGVAYSYDLSSGMAVLHKRHEEWATARWSPRWGGRAVAEPASSEAEAYERKRVTPWWRAPEET